MFQRDEEQEAVEGGAMDIVDIRGQRICFGMGQTLRSACITALALSTLWGTVRNLDVIITVRFILN